MNKFTHILKNIFEERCNLKITLKHGYVVTISELYPIDYSIYKRSGGWSCIITKVITLPSDKTDLYSIGSGLDFYEEDVQSVMDVDTAEVIYSAKPPVK